MITQEELDNISADFMTFTNYDDFIKKYPYDRMKKMKQEIERSSSSKDMRWKLDTVIDLYNQQLKRLYSATYPTKQRKSYLEVFASLFRPKE